MSACNIEVIKSVGRYYNAPVGTVCYNTDKVLTTVLNKQNIEGFASIVLKLGANAGINLNNEQLLLSYQWLEHIAMYANQAAANPVFAKTFLQNINKALERNTYLTGQSLTVADIAAYYVLYSLIERLTVIECESLIHLCRWMRHIQAQPKCERSTDKSDTLPPQVLPHELKDVNIDKPVVFHPQPFSYPGYPVIVYL